MMQLLLLLFIPFTRDIRYQKRYITIIKKLGIVIEPEEVAKIINNEPMSLSFEDDSDIEEFMNDSLHMNRFSLVIYIYIVVTVHNSHY